MKLFKKLVLGILIILVLSAIGGYFYVETKFTPPPNKLKVSKDSGAIQMKWLGDANNAHAALLLPVKIKGFEEPLYMQLDFGSPETILYTNTIRSLAEGIPGIINYTAKDKALDLTFALAGMTVSCPDFRLLDYGNEIDLSRPGHINIIGTIGTDLLEKRTIKLDFVRNVCGFSNEVQPDMVDFQFKKRKILLPAIIGDEQVTLMYDSGTSGYELITSKKNWTEYKSKAGKMTSEKANSWGKTLNIISAPSNRTISMSGKAITISEVTYVEGTSQLQQLLMKFSGVEGMVGNKLFLGRSLILDCKNQKFKILD